MPNHCHNDLYIQGSDENVAAILARIGADKETPEFDFNSVIKMPHEFEGQDGYNKGGYEWCCANWDTKWNAYNVVRRDYDGVCITFQTAWCPPKKVIVELAKLHPECNFYLEFFERGMAYCGGMSLPSESDYWPDEGGPKWHPGIVVASWEMQGYLGHRGG